MRRPFILAAAATLLAAAWLTAGAAPAREACDAPGFQAVLRAAPKPASEARAVWLDARLIRWPQVEGKGRFSLYHSAAGQIVAATGDKVRGADGALALEAFSGSVPAAVAQRFKYLSAGATLALARADSRRLRELHRAQLVLAHEDADGRVRDATELQAAGALDALYASAGNVPDLGLSIGRGKTGFKLWAPTAQQVALCLYRHGSGAAEAIVPMRLDPATGIWHAARPADLSGHYYTYLVDVLARGSGLVRNHVTDPYSISLSTDSKRSYIADLNARDLKPDGWDASKRPARVAAQTDIVVYELHVRDFSIGDMTVSPPHRGKYGAFTETGSDGMKHLLALSGAGLTDVHLLPVFDLASVPESGCKTPDIAAAGGAPDGTSQQAAATAVADADCYNWGYDPLHFNAPEGSFATDAADGARRIVEFRQMVQALHRAGLRVGMDVVYNHTSASGQNEKSVLDRIVPGYYHRLNATGAVETSTCCANTATENLMMAKLMVDSAVVWARDHHIDSFRFDLMGHQPRATMEQLLRAVNAATGRHIHLIGEGWNFGEVADGKRFVQASQLALGGSGIATFSDRGRDAVRGGGAGDNGADQIARQGYVNGLVYDPNALAPASLRATDLMRSADMVRVGLAGSIRSFAMQTHQGQTLPLERITYGDGRPAGYASQPGEVVNYVENHDNQTLFDANVFKLPAATSREDRARVQTLASAIVAFSQGVAYFHAGQELLRSKSMDRNSFDSGDWFNRIDWTGRDNFFGAGLPPQRENGASWPLMAPLLANPAIKPTPAEIAWTRDAFIDLLRIRASSTLFRLRTAADIQARLSFHNTGPAQVPTVLVGHLDGHGYPGAGFAELLYLINVDKLPQTITVEALKGKPFALHPVHTAPGAADPRAARATNTPTTGAFSVPPRSAVVWVLN